MEHACGSVRHADGSVTLPSGNTLTADGRYRMGPPVVVEHEHVSFRQLAERGRKPLGRDPMLWGWSAEEWD